MNAAITLYEDQELSYSLKTRPAIGTKRSSMGAGTNRPNYSRSRGKTPLSCNGIHRRHAKKIRW
jgi:hypothetical protein